MIIDKKVKNMIKLAIVLVILAKFPRIPFTTLKLIILIFLVFYVHSKLKGHGIW